MQTRITAVPSVSLFAKTALRSLPTKRFAPNALPSPRLRPSRAYREIPKSGISSSYPKPLNHTGETRMATNVACWNLGPAFFRKQDDEFLTCVDCGSTEVTPESFCDGCGCAVCPTCRDPYCKACQKDIHTSRRTK